MTTTRRQFLAHAGAALMLPMVGRSQQPEPMVRYTPSVPKEPVVPPVNYDALLWAIAEVETGQRDDVVGPCGARSRYQITETVWKQHVSPVARPFSHRNFKSVCKGDAAAVVASKHIDWLNANIPRLTITELYERWVCLAWAWHGGLESWTRYTRAVGQHSVMWASSPTADRLNDYAIRVSNLYALRLKGQA